jgi:hypothetical protein
LQVLSSEQASCAWCCSYKHHLLPMPPKHSKLGFKTKYKCSCCDIALCVSTRYNGVSCFYAWHHARDLLDPCTPEVAASCYVRQKRPRGDKPTRKANQLRGIVDVNGNVEVEFDEKQIVDEDDDNEWEDIEAGNDNERGHNNNNKDNNNDDDSSEMIEAVPDTTDVNQENKSDDDSSCPDFDMYPDDEVGDATIETIDNVEICGGDTNNDNGGMVGGDTNNDDGGSTNVRPRKRRSRFTRYAVTYHTERVTRSTTKKHDARKT